MVPCSSRMLSRSAALTGLIAVLLVVPGAAQQLGVDRHVSLEGARNFRDIGGYATSDGRHVRQGLLFRSGALAQLTESDYQALARLNIETVCDFRQDWEKQSAPTRWPGRNAPELLSLPNPGQAGPTYVERLANGATAADMTAYMLRAYETVAVEHAPSYAATLRRIVNSDRPVLYHCTSGKDRTGVFTALLLSFLGVSRSTVFEDYLLSNDYVATPPRIEAAAVQLKASSAAAVKPLLRVERTYLETAFRVIDERYRSLNNYRRTALALSDEDLNRLKARLLEN